MPKKDGGSYVLILRLARKRLLEVGKSGEREFQPGRYAYVGSAMGGIAQRVARHLRKEKRLRWHIDYLLQVAEIERVVKLPGSERRECEIAARFARVFASVAHFGCGDCRCGSHLFFLGANRL